MSSEQNRELEESLAYMREQFRPLTQSIPIPESLQADVLRRRLDAMQEGQQAPASREKVVFFPWKRVMGVAACLVVAVGSYLMLENFVKLTPNSVDAPMPMAAAASPAEQTSDTQAVSDTALDEAVPEMAMFSAPVEAGDGLAVTDEEASPKMARGAMAGDQPVAYEGPNVEATLFSMEEIRAVEPYGKYLPEQLFAGMTGVQGFEAPDQLTVTMVGLSAELLVCVSPMNEALQGYIANPNDPQTWDMNLYPVPWADTVPEKYSWVISDVIFRAEEITLDMIRARITVTDEPDKMRAQFSVLYGDVLVRYNFINLAADDVFQMIQTTKTVK